LAVLILTPTSGHYYLNVDVAGTSDAELAMFANLKGGFCIQQFHLLPRNGTENVMLPMVYAGVEANVRRDRAIAAACGESG